MMWYGMSDLDDIRWKNVVWGPVLLKYLTVIIGLFTVLVMVVKCSMNSIDIAAKSFVLRHVWVIVRVVEQ